MALPHGEVRTKCIGAHYKIKKLAIMLGISPKNVNVLLKYVGGPHIHLWKKMMMFKHIPMDEASVHAQYLENKGLKKGKSSGFK